MSRPSQNGAPIGLQMYGWASELYPICRSITGEGSRKTLRFIQSLLPKMKIHEVASGTPAFDWTVPDEWNVRQAWIKDASGQTIVDLDDHNLHVMGYAAPVDRVVDLDELQEHLYSLEDRPDAIPYVTSYYERRWGFCIRHNRRQQLKPGNYHVYIDSTLEPGSLSYGELILEGKDEREVLLSTYICHPSMANNELSGPVVTTALARWLSTLSKRRWTYRIVFVPESIGSILYLSRHLETMKRRTIAGFVLTCVGDDRTYSYLASRRGDTLADRVARHVLEHHDKDYETYSFLERGSDERQYCSVGVDLPVALMMRSKFGEYPEYHTSDDDLSLISPAGLAGAYEVHRRGLHLLEHNATYRTALPCEPQLGRRGLYPTLSTRDGALKQRRVRLMRDILAYADGRHDLIALADRLGVDARACLPVVHRLLEEGLLEVSDTGR